MSTDQTSTEPTIRTVRVIRRRYLIVSTPDGLSDVEETSTDVIDVPCAPSSGSYFDGGLTRTVWWHETAARDAVTTIRSDNLSYSADGGDWFGYPEPSTVDYATGEEEETTAHLVGPWTDTERRAVVRMVEWLDRRADERAAAYLARSR